MSGKEGSTKRGMKASARRRQGRRPAGAGGEGCFSLGQCTTKHMEVEEAAAAGEEGDFSLGSCTTTERMEVEEAATGKKGTFSLMPCTATRHMAALTGEEGGFSLGQCATKHMAVEEPVMGSFSLRPCATKLVAADEAVAGEDGPPKGCPAKRKAAARFPKAGECEAERERSSFLEQQRMYAPMLRERVKASLVTFPEAAALDTDDELDAAVDRIIKQSSPETASATAPGMCRLSDEDIGAFFCHETEIPTVDDLAPGGVFPPGWLEQRRLQLDEEVQPEKKKLGQDLDVLLAKIRVDLLTKGYVEVPQMYFEDTPDAQAARMEQAAEEHKEYTGVAGPDDDEWWLQDDTAVLTRMILQSS